MGCWGYRYRRSFLTREENIKYLEGKEYLEQEVAGVAERIEELKKKQ
jgi:hypothetical protein